MTASRCGQEIAQVAPHVDFSSACGRDCGTGSWRCSPSSIDLTLEMFDAILQIHDNTETEVFNSEGIFSPAASFHMQQWRLDRKFRQDLIRTITLDVLRLGRNVLDDRLAWLKTYLGYYLLERKDRGIVMQNMHYIRTIVTHWNLADAEMQAAFIGGTAPSSMSTELKRLRAQAARSPRGI